MPPARIASPPSESAETTWARLLIALERAQRRLESRLGQLAEGLGLSLAEIQMLIAVGSLDGDCPQRELCDRLGCSPGHVSGVVERLRGRGLLSAERQARDRRRQCWRLTDAGQACLRAFWRAWHERHEDPHAFQLSAIGPLADGLESLRANCFDAREPRLPRLAVAPGGPLA